MSTRDQAPVVLGQGAFGMVLMVHAEDGPRARKVLQNSAHNDRFTQEKTVLQLLNDHKVQGVPQFLGEGAVATRNGEILFFDMTLYKGSLSNFMTPPKGAQEAITIVSHLARLLQPVHDLQIIHRDLKPDNILVAEDGTLAIGDWGIAKNYHTGEPNLTGGGFYGTPHYYNHSWSTEDDLSPARDVYALARIFLDLVGLNLKQGPEHLSDSGLRRIIADAFNAKYSSMDAFRDALLLWIPAPPKKPSNPQPPQAKAQPSSDQDSNGLLAVGLGLGALALLGIGAYALANSDNEDDDRRTAKRAGQRHR